MQRKWKRRWQRLARRILPPLAAGLLLISAYNPAYANPTGGTVVSVSAGITANGNTTTINQTTNKAIINWQSFSIGKGETVNFLQPSASAVALNRVVGSDPSTIYGTLNANGKVFLINPNGILFAPGAQVSAGGLVASTLNLSDNDFLNGNYAFEKNGSAGAVVNQGNITAADHVALLGPEVKNEGVIAARVTGLAAGNKVSLDFNGDKLLNVTVDTGAAGGSAVNSGTINATGGLVVMSAGTKDKLLNTVVNNSGGIRAQSVSNVNGVIRLQGGSVTNSGTLDASGKASGQTGGTVKVLGDTVTLANGSNIDVSGDTGGGAALIGGAYQGKGPEYNAANTTVAAGATINADAVTRGNGGNVVVWANDKTNFTGTITARGGKSSGNGGSVETSGHTLTVSGTVDAGSTKGNNGSWLLDPEDLTVDSAAANAISSSLNSNTNVTLQTTSTTASGSGTVSSGNGDITINAPLAWTTGAGILTLSAYNNINLNSSITAPNGGLTLAANTSGTGNGTTTGIITPATGSSISVGTFTLQSGTWRENSSSLSSFYAKDFRFAGGAFLRAKGGNGTIGDPYQIVDVYGLQGIASSAGLLGSSFELVNNIDASGTKNWNTQAGFVPIGNATTYYSGSFDGKGHTISELHINRSGTDYVGLFGMTNDNGTISNLGIIGGSVTGKAYTGGLVGHNRGRIDQCYYEGTVSGTTYVGGLVGFQDHYAAIYSSHTAGVVAGSDLGIGGLVGQSGRYDNSDGKWSLISACYSSSTVKGGTNGYCVGGLVGFNAQKCQITQSFATGAVSGEWLEYGGLAGQNDGTITYSYSTGTVHGYMYSGGLVGSLGVAYDGAALKFCYSTGDVYGTSSPVGGLVGSSMNGSIESCYSTGAVSPASTYIGGFLGKPSGNVKVQNCYYDAAKNSGLPGIAGDVAGSVTGSVVGLTTDQMMKASNFVGWNIVDTANNPSYTTADWVIVNGSTRPFLKNEYSTNITNVHQLQLMAMDLGANYTLANNIDMSEVKQSSGLWATSAAVPGFLPIGTNTAPFTGSFTGNGYFISNIYINRIGIDFAGLFGVSTGQISGVALLGGSVLGGQAGGLVGFIKTSAGKVTGSYSTCSVTGVGNAGGLVGENKGLISDCYSTGSVSGQSSVGGLVGRNTGTIKYSYSTGVVSGSGVDIGGLVGNNALFVIDSYWDTETSGKSNSDGGTPRTTADMMTGGNFQNFDFANTWGIVEGSSYPYLRSQYAAAPQVVSGTVSDHGKGYAVNLVSQGNLLNTVYTGANGFYYFLLDQGTITADNALLAYINDGSIKGSALRNVASATDSITGLTITAGTVTVNGAAGVLDITGLMTKAIGGLTDTDFLYSVSGAALNVEKDLSVTAAGGSITQSGALTVNGTTTLSAGNGISLGKANKLTGTVSLSSSAGDVTINNTVATVLGTSNISGNLGVTSNGAITQSGALTVTGTTTLTAGSGNDITLGQAANALTGAISIASGKAVILNNTLATVLGIANVSNNLGVSSGGAITQSGALTVSGTTNLTAGSGNNITLDKANALTGAISITSGNDVTLKNNKATKIGASAVSGSLNVTSNGAITQSGALTVTGTTTLAAGSGNNITLDQAANALTGAIRIASGKAVTLNNTLATVLGISNISNNLVVSSGGAITQNGALTVTGTTTLAAGSSNNITLDQAANALTGAISITSGNDVTIKNALATGLDNASVSGKLTLIADDAVNSLTLTVNGAVSAADDILLEAPGNFTIGGAASIHSSNGNVSLVSTQGNFLNNAGSNAVLAGSGKRWLIYVKSPTGNTPGNLAYDFSQYGTAYGGNILAAGNAFIYSDALNVTASLVGQVTKTYDGTVAADVKASNISMSGLSGAVYDGIGIGEGSYYDGSNAGTGIKVTTGIVSLTGIKDSNNKPVYGYNYTPSALSGNIGVINKANLIITASDVTKTYDGLAYSGGNGVTYSGFVTGEDANELGGSLSYGSSSQGARNAGTYTITASGLTSGNYDISYASGTLTIIARPITITPNAGQSKIYGEADPALTYTATGGTGTTDSAIVSGDSLNGMLAYTGTNVGNYVIGQGSLTIANNSNYAITYTNPSSTTFSITARPITVTPDTGQSKIYGETVPNLTYTVSNGAGTTGSAIVSGDNLTFDGSLTRTAGSNVGSYAISQGSLTLGGTASGNYTLVYSNPPSTSFAITPRPITITPNAGQNKIYGDADPSLTYTVSNGAGTTGNAIVSGDSLNGALAYTGTNVGNYLIGQGSLTSANNTNYTITYSNPSSTTFAITPRPIAVTANNASKVYGDVNPTSGAVTLTAGSLAGSDTLGSANLSSAATTTSSVGNYTLTPSGVSFTSGDASNYNIIYANGTLTITPRPITVTANNASKVYGDANPASGAVALTAGSLVGSDALGSANLSSTATTTSSVGDYTLTPSGVNFTSGSAANYNISYANGTLTITPRPITVTANNASKVYGDANPASGAVTLTAGSLVGSDTLGSASLSSNATTSSSVGDYTLTPSGVSFTNGSASNYNISYANGTLTVNPAHLTVTANNATKYTGQANPAFTASYSGLANGDSPASLTGALTFGTAATTASGPGTYTITLTGTLFSPNYTINYVNGVLTVSGRATNPAYDGAVIYAQQTAFHLPGSGGQPRPLSAYWSPLSGYMAGAAGTYVPLTIRGSGINTGGITLQTQD